MPILSESPKSLPKDYLAVIDSALHIDGADYMLGILRKKMSKYFRIVQLGFKKHADSLEIVNLQGSGPEMVYRQYGLKTKQLYTNLQDTMNGMKPVNALIGALAMMSKDNPDLQSVFYSRNDRCPIYGLNYATVLQAAKFRKTADDILSLNLSLPTDKILERITGKDPERLAYLAGLIEDFRSQLENVI